MIAAPTRPGLYFVDNGSILCLVHLGSSARYTGRDISGQPIDLITKEAAAAFEAEAGCPPECEHCGRQFQADV